MTNPKINNETSCVAMMCGYAKGCGHCQELLLVNNPFTHICTDWAVLLCIAFWISNFLIIIIINIYFNLIWTLCWLCNYTGVCIVNSDVWNVGSYLSEVEKKREQLISSLSLQQQKVHINNITAALLLVQELGYLQHGISTLAAKRIRLDPEITEDGIYEFHIQYNK